MSISSNEQLIAFDSSMALHIPEIGTWMKRSVTASKEVFPVQHKNWHSLNYFLIPSIPPSNQCGVGEAGRKAYLRIQTFSVLGNTCI
jgi:hypothetical protein